MSFEDDMIEDGFSDEQEYLAHLESEADDWYDRHNSSDYNDDSDWDEDDNEEDNEDEEEEDDDD